MHFWFYLGVITTMNFYLTLPSNASSQIYSEIIPVTTKSNYQEIFFYQKMIGR